MRYRQVHILVLTREGQWHRLTRLQLPSQLLALRGLGWGQPLQSSAVVASQTAVRRLWGGRGYRPRHFSAAAVKSAGPWPNPRKPVNVVVHQKAPGPSKVR